MGLCAIPVLVRARLHPETVRAEPHRALADQQHVSAAIRMIACRAGHY